MAQQDHPYYLQQMGIDIWTPRQLLNSESNKLEELANKVAHCTKCPLSKSRTNTVFCKGNPQAKLMIIGEAPGYNEDKQGLPFVGRAGALLNEMLHSIGLKEGDVYIANVLKCRPPDNRDPHPDEIEQCSGYLAQQIALVSPSLLLALGRFAAQYLVQQKLPLNQMRSQVHYYEKKPFVVSYHPAYLLRKPTDKKKAYLDLLYVKKLLETDVK